MSIAQRSRMFRVPQNGEPAFACVYRARYSIRRRNSYPARYNYVGPLFVKRPRARFSARRGSEITLMVYVYRVLFSPHCPPFPSYGILLRKSFHSIFDAPEWHRAIGAVNLRLLDLSVSPFRVSRIRAQLYSSFRDTMNDLLDDRNIQRNNILNILNSVKERNSFPNLYRFFQAIFLHKCNQEIIKNYSLLNTIFKKLLKTENYLNKMFKPS